MDRFGVSHMHPTSDGLDALGELKKRELSQDDRAALERTVWRKLDRWIVPLCTSFFLLAALDRTSIGNARVAGLQTSLAISNYQFTVALTVTLFVVTQLPITLLLKYVGPNIMLPAMATLWGVIAALQGLVKNYSGLLACRIFLGLVEGGIPPSIVLYLSLFYPRNRLQIRIATFNATTSLSVAFSGLLAAAIDQLDGMGGKPGWAWIFILEGIFTFIFGIISFFFLPRSPETARFLTEDERRYVVSALKQAGSVSSDDNKDSFNRAEVVRAVQSPHVWFLAIMSFIDGALLIGQVYFEPTIVAGLGYTGNQAQLMTVPPFVVTFIVAIISAIVSDRYQCRGYIVAFFSLLELIGFSMFYASGSIRVRYASLFFSITGTFSTLPTLMTWVANNSAPHARRATAVAISSIMIESGGILATWLLGSLSSPPKFTAAIITFIIMSGCSMFLAIANVIYLAQENRSKEKQRQKMGKEEEPEGLGDRSAWFIYSL